MASVHRCDVCRDEKEDPSVNQRIQIRLNLYGVALPAGDNFVHAEMDVCPRSACRRQGIHQLAVTIEEQALARAGLSPPKAV